MGLILLTVCHTILMTLVWRIWYWICLKSPEWYFLYSYSISSWFCIKIVRRNSVLITHGVDKMYCLINTLKLWTLHSHGFPSVVGRNLLTLKDFTSDEIGYLLWTAADLKQRIKNGNEVGLWLSLLCMANVLLLG